jgi:acyl-homoserine lactone acylase PvdQ
MRVGASYRHVVDLADPERTARMVSFGGQSGSVGSKHYDDLMPLWLEGRFVPMRLATLPETGRELRLVRA